MHEWALAEGVVASAQRHADAERLRRVTRLVVRVGELQRIDPDFFRQALEAVLPEDDPRLAGVELELRREPAAFSCRACGHDFELAEAAGELDAERLEAIHFVPELAHGYLGCPRCASPDFEVGRGRGIWLDAIEGEG